MKQRGRKKQLARFFATNTVLTAVEEQDLDISDEADPDVKALKITVDDSPVSMTNGSGNFPLNPGNHVLAWAAVGNEGGIFKIVGKVGDVEVVKVEDQKINIDGIAGGVKPFRT